MLTVNVHQAKTNLSKLLSLSEQGESFIIAKAGKPVAKVVPIEAAEPKAPQRIGFAKGMFTIPDDFDTMFQQEIEAMFYESKLFPDEEEETGEKPAA